MVVTDLRTVPVHVKIFFIYEFGNGNDFISLFFLALNDFWQGFGGVFGSAMHENDRTAL